MLVKMNMGYKFLLKIVVFTTIEITMRLKIFKKKVFDYFKHCRAGTVRTK